MNMEDYPMVCSMKLMKWSQNNRRSEAPIEAAQFFVQVALG
jgi:hypothetical protein